MTKYFVDIEGNYIGGFDGATPPEGSIEVANPPEFGGDFWDGTQWQARNRPINTQQFFDDVVEDILAGNIAVEFVPFAFAIQTLEQTKEEEKRQLFWKKITDSNPDWLTSEMKESIELKAEAANMPFKSKKSSFENEEIR
jgi:hypothetical protein